MKEEKEDDSLLDTITLLDDAMVSWDDDGIYRPSFTGGLLEDSSLYDQSEDSSWDDPEENRIVEDIDPDTDEHLVKANLIQDLECALGSKLPNDIWQLSIPQLRKRLSDLRYKGPTKEDKKRAKQIMNKLKR